MIGSASLAPAEQPSVAHPCNACQADCLDACFNDAIVAIAGEGVRVQAASCAGCGACIPACASRLIRLQDGAARIESSLQR